MDAKRFMLLIVGTVCLTGAIVAAILTGHADDFLMLMIPIGMLLGPIVIVARR